MTNETSSVVQLSDKLKQRGMKSERLENRVRDYSNDLRMAANVAAVIALGCEAHPKGTTPVFNGLIMQYEDEFSYDVHDHLHACAMACGRGEYKPALEHIAKLVEESKIKALR